MMVFDIELTRQSADRYIARVLLLPDVVVEASSRGEALELIRTAIRERRNAGVEIVQVAIDDESHAASVSWRKHAGTFPDDALHQQMLEEIERYRRELDADTSP
jgi:predicted acetyltransferase